jgi:hypothetical protein
MAVLNRSAIPAPILPKETVEVPSLNGDVVVQGLMLKDRMELLFSESETGRINLSLMLSMTVVDDKGDPIFTEQQWELFGATNFTESLVLFKVAKRLSGLDAEVSEKK